MTQTPTEYAALDFDGTERRANYRTIAYREDILCLCEHKDAAAIVYEIVYWWQTNVRKREVLKELERRKKAGHPPMTEEEVEDMMWVWMSYNDFVRESGEAVAYNTVIRMLDYLVGTAQILECRENHDPRYPDYEYRIRMDVVKEKLKALPASPAFLPKVPKKKEKKGNDSTQVGTPQKRYTQKGRRAQRSTQVGTESTQKGRATTQVGTEVYPNRGTSHNYSHTPHIEHAEEEDTSREDYANSGSLHSPTPALVSHPEYGFLWFDDPVTPSHMVVRLTPEYPHPYHSPDEDKRRERIAGWEVEPYLKARGLNVSVIFMHDLGNETTGESAPSPAPFSSKLSRFFDNAVESAARFQELTQRPVLTESHTAEEQLPFDHIAIDTPTHERGEQHGTGTRPTPGNLRPDLHGGTVAPGHDAPAGESRVSGRSLAAAGAQRGDHPAQGTPERGRGKATRSDSGQPGDTSVAGSGGRIEKGEQHFSTGRNSFPQDSAKVEPKKQGSKDKKKSEEPEPIVLSPEAEKLWRAWCSLFTVEVKLIPANAKAAEELVKPARLWCSKLHWTLAEWLKALKDNAYATDTRGYYDRRGVKLFDIPRELEGWQSAKEHELAKLAQAAEPKSVTPPPMNPTLESLYRLRQQRMGVTS